MERPTRIAAILPNDDRFVAFSGIAILPNGGRFADAEIGVPTNRVKQILNGARSITGDSALRLAHFFGTSAQFWLNLQSLYDLRLAQEKAGKSIDALPKLKRSEPVHA